MDFELPKSRVYILLDEDNRITRIEGEYTLPSDLTDWILVDEGYGDRYNLAQTHYLDKSLMTEDGIYRYKYEDGEIVERTAEEVEADIQPVSKNPSALETLEAQIMYTALNTGTLLEE